MGEGDWLESHPTKGQSVAAFLHRKGRKEPDRSRRRIYILPLGKEFVAGTGSVSKRFPDLLPTVERYCGAFFRGLSCRVMEPVTSLRSVRSRRNQDTHQRQLYVPDLFTICRDRLPKDAFCVIGITFQDLYPAESWNFVFGKASLANRYGVFSLARFDPDFWGSPRPPDYEDMVTLRTLKVCAHEITHMFGVTHCCYFACMMNGSNSEEESIRRPLHMCPICLRKLTMALKCDPEDRYQALLEVYESMPGVFGETGAAEWVRDRLEFIRTEALEPEPSTSSASSTTG